MKSTYPSVSVIIPVKNEALKIRACIDGIMQQTVPVHEIIVIDSGSTDDTVAILQSYPQVTLIEIPAASFNHGETRNLGAQKASGEFLLFTVGDACPYNEHWIEELLNGFVNEYVAAVCGQQVVPHDLDKNPIEWFRPISEPKLIHFQYKVSETFDKLSPTDKKNACGWDDVTAMYRRNVLLAIPFRKTSYAEDLLWCKDALLNYYAVVYNYKARVYHYHNESPDFIYKRTFTVLYYQFIGFGYVPEKVVLNIRKLISITKQILFNHRLNFGQKLHWLKYNFNNSASLRKSVRDFIYWHAKGSIQLEEQHTKICGHAPIPLK